MDSEVNNSMFGITNTNNRDRCFNYYLGGYCIYYKFNHYYFRYCCCWVLSTNRL